MPEGALTVPNHRTDKAKAEWDWYYQLGPADRKRVLRHCKPGGLAPDTCAHASRFDYVDEWAAELVAAVTAKAFRGQQVVTACELSNLVGPVEVADMLGVKVDTVYQWATRNRLPLPWAVVSGTRIWAREEIEDWAVATGRLVFDQAENF